VLGFLIIKHLCNLDDRETVVQVSENIYMQYFLGYSSFTSDKPFDASLFVEIRKRLGMEALNAINEKIVSLKTRMEEKNSPAEKKILLRIQIRLPAVIPLRSSTSPEIPSPTSPEHKGKAIFDATACPQDIPIRQTWTCFRR
jgi:hypothetical protein